MSTARAMTGDTATTSRSSAAGPMKWWSVHDLRHAGVKGPPLRCVSHGVARPSGAALDPGSGRQRLAPTINP